MAKTTSKSKTSSRSSESTQPAAKKLPKSPFLRRVNRSVTKFRTSWRDLRRGVHRPHKSFRRSYREDYARSTPTPGLLSHAMTTFQLLFQNWRIFLPFLIVMVIAYIALVGIFSEDVYLQFQDSINESSERLANGQIGNFAKAGLLLISTVTTGGLDIGKDEVGTIFTIFLFLVIWLVTIYLVRHLIAGGKPKMRDGLYNALAPLISTLLVFAVIFVQAIPIILVVITYSAAVATGFLSAPFYALLYFLFAALMILISVYLFSSSIIALTAVTAPGVYPLRALFTASDLMSGRRIRFVLRLLYLIVVVALIYVVIMTPIILLDLWFKSMWGWIQGWPIVPFCLLAVTCFVAIYATTYIYRYYRWLLDYQEK